jgi:hypothetical protein
MLCHAGTQCSHRPQADQRAGGAQDVPTRYSPRQQRSGQDDGTEARPPWQAWRPCLGCSGHSRGSASPRGRRRRTAEETLRWHHTLRQPSPFEKPQPPTHRQSRISPSNWAITSVSMRYGNGWQHFPQHMSCSSPPTENGSLDGCTPSTATACSTATASRSPAWLSRPTAKAKASEPPSSHTSNGGRSSAASTPSACYQAANELRPTTSTAIAATDTSRQSKHSSRLSYLDDR